MNKNKLIILTGPTAVGKTSLSIKLAQKIGGEIISADSMQVYKKMNIGSAKITTEEMRDIPHYLIDIIPPTDDFNVVSFKEMATNAINTIYSHNKIPIIVGGTGFYIQSVLYDIDFTDEADNKIRKELEELYDEKGIDYLWDLLLKVDIEATFHIHKNNTRKVIRALEYFYETGEKISEHNQKERSKESPFNFEYFVLNMPREELFSRIDSRVDKMIEGGLVEEVKTLLSDGCQIGMTSMQGLGYKEIVKYLSNEISLEDAIYAIKRDTRHFAKRQLTWFKRERCVKWINKEEFDYDDNKILEYILNILGVHH